MPDYYSHPTADTLLSGIALTGDATAAACLDDVYPTNDGDTTRVSRSGATGNGEFRMQKQALPALSSVATVTLWWAARQVHAGSVFAIIKPYLYIGGVKYYAPDNNPTTGASYNEYSYVWSVNPATSLFWTKDAFEAAEVGFEFPRDEGEFDSIQYMTYARFIVSGVPAEPGKTREIGTALLNVVRRSLEYVNLDAGHLILDNELGDDLSLFHPQHPLTEVLGTVDRRGIRRTGVEGWRSLLVEWEDVRVDMNSFVSSVTLRRRRDELTTFYDGGESRVSAASIENGVPFLAAGGSKFYTRASKAWNTDPVSGLVVPFAHNERPIAANGFTPENFTRQWVINSSFVTNLTGITRTGDGTSVRETSPPSPLFRPDVSNACLKMTAGNPHSASQVNEWSCVITENDLPLRLSIDHMDDSGAALEWQVARADNGDTWDDTTGEFDPTNNWNALPVRTTRARDESAFVIYGGDAATLYLRIRQPSGGTASRVNRLYHVQLEDNLYGLVSSWIVSDGAVVSRETQLFGGTNNAGKRSFHNAHGTAFVEIIPQWTAAQMNAIDGFPPVFTLDHDVNNAWFAFYNGVANSRFDFAVKYGGSQVSAYAGWPPVKGQLLRLAFRWLPLDQSMHNLPAGTISAFVNGVKGTDAIRGANPTEASTSNIYVGTLSGVALCGVVRRTRFTPQVYSDAEIASYTW